MFVKIFLYSKKALSLFYDSTKYEKIKNKYEINNDIIKI